MVAGVTLVDMQVHTGSTRGQISLIFVFASAAGLLSSLVIVPLHNYINTFLLMAVSSLVYGFVLAASPWSTSLAVYIAFSAVGNCLYCLSGAGKSYLSN